MKRSNAWALDLGLGLQAAVGEREMVHLLPSPQLFDVPATPLHCRQVVVWEEQILPVVDLAVWLTGRNERQQVSLVGVFAYQVRRGASAERGALLLQSIPRRLFVSDDQASALPEEPTRWREVAISCFSTSDGATMPIIDLAHLFAQDLSESRGVSQTNRSRPHGHVST